MAIGKAPGSQDSVKIHKIRLSEDEWKALDPEAKKTFNNDADLLDISRAGLTRVATKLGLLEPERASLEDILRAKKYIL